ncbi:MAG TPA: hypothetical protein P5096_01425 [Patescibacteria group bacterium]|nr:hypothetical protein [Patescibacteria group bacterium]
MKFSINPEYLQRKDILNEPLKDNNVFEILENFYRKESLILPQIENVFNNVETKNIFNVLRYPQDKILGSEENFRNQLIRSSDELKNIIRSCNKKRDNKPQLVSSILRYFLNQVDIDFLRKIYNSKNHLETMSNVVLETNVDSNMIIAKEMNKFIRNNIGEDEAKYQRFLNIIRTTANSFLPMYCKYLETNGKPLRSRVGPQEEIKAMQLAKSQEHIIEGLINNIEGIREISSNFESAGFEILYPTEKVDKENKIDLVARRKKGGKLVLCQIKSEKQKDIDNKNQRVIIKKIETPYFPINDDDMVKYKYSSNIEKLKNDWRAIYDTLQGLRSGTAFQKEMDKERYAALQGKKIKMIEACWIIVSI